MKNKDLRLGITLMVIFLILFGVSFTIQHSDVMKTHTTAAFFPRVILIVALILTALLIIQSLLKGGEAAGKKMDPDRFKRVLFSMAAALLFGLGVSYIGTFVSISLFIIAIMLTWGVRNAVSILLNAVITPIIVYVVFTKILLVQLPSGILI